MGGWQGSKEELELRDRAPRSSVLRSSQLLQLGANHHVAPAMGKNKKTKKAPGALARGGKPSASDVSALPVGGTAGGALGALRSGGSQPYADAHPTRPVLAALSEALSLPPEHRRAHHRPALGALGAGISSMGTIASSRSSTSASSSSSIDTMYSIVSSASSAESPSATTRQASAISSCESRAPGRRRTGSAFESADSRRRAQLSSSLYSTPSLYTWGPCARYTHARRPLTHSVRKASHASALRSSSFPPAQTFCAFDGGTASTTTVTTSTNSSRSRCATLRAHRCFCCGSAAPLPAAPQRPPCRRLDAPPRQPQCSGARYGLPMSHRAVPPVGVLPPAPPAPVHRAAPPALLRAVLRTHRCCWWWRCCCLWGVQCARCGRRASPF